MKSSNIHSMPLWSWVLTAACFISGCSEGVEHDVINFEALPQVVPQKMAVFDSADTLFLGYLSHGSIPLDDGSVVIGDRMQKLLLRIHPEEERSEVLASEGRGPGEIQDVTSLHSDEKGDLYVFDGTNQKVIRFREGRDLLQEFIPEALGELSLWEVIPMGEDAQFLTRHTSTMNALQNPGERLETIFSLYRSTDRSYSKQITVPSRLHAVVHEARGSSMHSVPFTADQLMAIHPDRNSFFLYRPDSDKIAELSPALDTLRIVPVYLPTEPLNQAEKDSVLDRIHPPEMRKTVENLFPAMKTPVERMLTDEEGRLWLNLTHQASTQRWLVLNSQGEPEKIVHFPSDVWVTHVSDHHIGVRADDVTFAVYEAVE